MYAHEMTESRPTRAAIPAFEPVSLDELKKHVELAASYHAHDAHLQDLLVVSREQVEHDTGLAIATGTYTWQPPCWPSCPWLEIPLRPVSSITQIQYVDTGGVTQVWSSAEYSLDANRPQPVIVLGYNYDWPTTRGYVNDITVTLVAGYATQAVVPRLVKQTVLIAAAQLFADREGSEMIAGGGKAYDMLIRRLQRSTYP